MKRGYKFGIRHREPRRDVIDKLRRAIRLIDDQGFTQRSAAIVIGMSDSGLCRSLKRWGPWLRERRMSLT